MLGKQLLFTGPPPQLSVKTQPQNAERRARPLLQAQQNRTATRPQSRCPACTRTSRERREPSGEGTNGTALPKCDLPLVTLLIPFSALSNLNPGFENKGHDCSPLVNTALVLTSSSHLLLRIILPVPDTDPGQLPGHIICQEPNFNTSRASQMGYWWGFRSFPSCHQSENHEL